MSINYCNNYNSRFSVIDTNDYITEDYGNLKASEGIKAGGYIVNVRTSVGVNTFAIGKTGFTE